MGFYFLPPPYACFDLGWDEKRFAKGLQELLQATVIQYDQEAHVVLIQNYLKHNPLENPNQVTSAVKRLDEVPQTRLFQAFIDVLKQHSKPFAEPLIERLRERLGQPGSGSGTGSGTGNKNICASDDARVCSDPQPGGSVEAEEVAATPEAKSGPRSPFRSKRQEQLFDEFWGQYPKKRSKGQAEKVWQKICPDDELFAEILHGLSLAKASQDWQKDGGQYIPYPATWLNAKGWEDEYQPARAGPRLSENVEKGLSLVEKYRRMEGGAE